MTREHSFYFHVFDIQFNVLEGTAQCRTGLRVLRILNTWKDRSYASQIALALVP